MVITQVTRKKQWTYYDKLDEIIAECSHDCPACLSCKNINYAKRLGNSYKNDAIKIADSDTIYLSCEMQTVALLWFPSNKNVFSHQG